VEAVRINISFRLYGTSNIVYVFEAPIDMLSFFCLLKKIGGGRSSYVALGGVCD
jgi:hypothetical protein